jgi:two-component system sensor histidine kinase/response regulator
MWAWFHHGPAQPAAELASVRNSKRMRELKDRAGREVARFVRVPASGEVCFDGKRHKRHCGEEAGMNDYLSKPIGTVALTAELEKFSEGVGTRDTPARATVTAQDEATFSASELLERVDNDRDLLKELVEIFREEFPGQLVQLRGAVAQQDLRRVGVLAHALRGMFANLAATRAAAAAAQLERMGKDGVTQGLAQAFARLESESAAVLPLLDSCLVEAHR